MTYEPSEVGHPGDTVVDYLEFNGWSQRDLARRTDLTPKTISEICNGKAPISPPTALAFEKAFRRPAHFWLNLQRQFDEAVARRQALDGANTWHTIG
jgi:addiction module HigA family antidote